MSVKEKIVAGALTALFILLLVAAYVALVVMGQAPVDPLLAVLSSLVVAAVGLINVFAGHASATSAAAQSAGTAPGVPLTIQAPLVSVTGNTTPASAPPGVTTGLQ